MNTRRFLTGCTITVVCLIVIAIIGGVIAWKRLAVSVPLPDSEWLIDDASVGHAVLHLDPNNPWISEMFSQMSRMSVRERHPEDVFPMELVWSARKRSGGQEGHILAMSFSPRGRLFGLASDLALWRAGRSNDGKVSRVEYGGEGITAFPGSPIPGNVFVRDNSIVWSSDIDTARHAVDLVVAHERSATTGTSAQPAFLKRMPVPGPHVLVGAISGEDGAPARCLGLLPGADLDIPEVELARADVSFAFDATSEDAASGEIDLHFPADTPSSVVETASSDLAKRLTAVKWGQIGFEATPRVEPGRGVVAVKVSGLSTLYGRLLEEVVRVQRTFVKEHGRPGSETPADPNQSSSTFQ